MNNNEKYNLIARKIKNVMPTNAKNFSYSDALIYEILNKYSKKHFNIFIEYLKTDKENIFLKNKVQDYLYKLYKSALSSEQVKQFNIIDRGIKQTLKELQFQYLMKFNETGALSIPPMQKNNSVVDNAEMYILRDKKGYYSNNAHIQNSMNVNHDLFDKLHIYILGKEEIMSGQVTMHNHKLSRKEFLIISYYLGYGSARDNLLEKQKRHKEKIIQKTKVK